MGFAPFDESTTPKLLIKDIMYRLTQYGVMHTTATSYVSQMRNKIRKTGASGYVIERYKVYKSQLHHHEISYQEFVTLVAILARYAEALEHNKLQHGSLSQVWKPASQGWHPALNRMVTLGLSSDQPIIGMDPFSLSRLKTPQELFTALHGFLGFHRKAKFVPDIENFDRFPCTQTNAGILFGHQQNGDIAFLYSRSDMPTRFDLGLAPEIIGKSVTDTYKISISWDMGSKRPLASFGIEELIAMCIPFGPMTLDLPLLTPPAQKTA